MVKRGIQKRGLDLIFGEAESRKQPDKVIKVKEPLVLYGRDDVNPASQNFTKYPNEIHPIMQVPLKGEEAAAIAYMYLWRISFGYGRNYCRVSLQTIERGTVIGSRKTVQRAINRLGAAKFIVKGRLKSGDQDKTQEGCLYRVLTPEEIANRITEEGVTFDDIPDKGVVILTPPKMTPPLNPNDNRVLSGSVKMGGDKLTPEQIVPTHFDTTGDDKQGGDKLTLPSESRANKQSGEWDQNDSTQNDTPFKEDSLKDSLSPDPVKLFYTGIGQQRISRAKREKGNFILKELQKEGFSPKDIQFAIEWTLKPGNTKEKLYDFSILTHTIGQALSARDTDKVAAESARKEADRVQAAETERRRLEGEIGDLRSKLSKAELTDLRKRAEKEIAQTDGIKKEFINEPLIVAKENEILRRKG